MAWRPTFRLLSITLWLVLVTPMAEAATEVRDVEFRVAAPGSVISIEDLLAHPEDRFGSALQESARQGIGAAPIWLELPPLRGGAILTVSTAVDSATLYERPAPGTSWTVSQSGDMVGRTGSALDLPEVAFELADFAGATTQRYLRVDLPTTSSVGVRVWDPASFRVAVDQNRIIRYILLGFVGAIVLYNLTIALFVRDAAFAFNAATIASFILIDLQISGFGTAYLWPPSWSGTVLSLGLGGALCFGGLFLALYMQADGASDARDLRAVRWIGFSGLLVAFASFLLPYWLGQTFILLGLVPAFFATSIAVALRRAWAGEARARLLLVPLALVMLPGCALAILNTFTALPVGMIRPHLLEVTLAVEALAFSLALGARIRIHMAEAQSAQLALAQAEAQSARRFAEVQESERARIATELHDSLGHNLALASGLLKRAAQEETSTDKAVSGQALSLIEDTVRGVRRLSHDLHPALIDHLGWARAVQELGASLEQAHGLKVCLAMPSGDIPLSRARQIHLYRVLQEATTNVAKHADAGCCRLTFTYGPDQVRVAVEDDGKGIDEGAAATPGLGLISIDQRVTSLGGTWSLGASDLGGVGVRLTIPVPPRDRQGAAAST